MALSKIQAESMNLTDTFAFTGTVSGVSSVGQGQTWTWVTSSRAISTVYQNTTGLPIMINVFFVCPFTSRGQLQVSASSGSGYITIADSDGGDYYTGSQYTDHYATVSAIIPNNIYYKVIPTSSMTLKGWTELR